MLHSKVAWSLKNKKLHLPKNKRKYIQCIQLYTMYKMYTFFY